MGINTTAMAGNIIARAIAEGDDTWRLFVPFELVWAGGADRPRRRAGALLVVSLQRAQQGAPGAQARGGVSRSEARGAQLAELQPADDAAPQARARLRGVQ